MNMENVPMLFGGDVMQYSNSVAHAMRKGEYLYSRGDLEGAMAFFVKASELDECSAAALNNIGAVWYKNNKLDKALEYFQKAFELDNGNAEFACNYMCLLFKMGSPGAAGRVLDSFVARGGDEKLFLRGREIVDSWSRIRCGSLEIPAMHVKDIHEVLGFPMPVDFPEQSLNKPLQYWRMELDDSPIFRYLYRNFRPRRHLEFGTWQGAGVVYCLEESDATVWTLNMPFGEVVDGKNQYTSGDSFDLQASMTDEWAERIGMDKRHTHRTDSFGFIGRFYLEKGLGHRVAQMYCDSTQWDDRAYPDGFFDSALIDGGHTTDVVVSDTRKALRLVRPGGLLMWHDFCPPLRQTYSVVEGVMSGLEQCSELLSDAMEQMFWVEPSWILVGIKK